MIIDDTIVASATPINVPTALSVVRLSGPQSKEILSHLIKKEVFSLTPRHAYYLKLNDGDIFIDEAIVILFVAPNSFTGEDTIEFYLHGSPYIAQKLINSCVKYGARLAEKGEFTLKAVLHGKMNLIEAERVNTLIHAKTLKAVNKASLYTDGINNSIKEIEEEITYLYAYFLQMLDYPEEYEDQEEDASNKLDILINKVIDLKKATATNNYLFNGVKVVIIGQPNVGKSTLLNKILGEEKAIVTSIEGTTRDIVEGQTQHNGILYSFYDTAGIHTTNEEIEKIGIRKSLQAIKKADLVLLLSDTGKFEDDFDISLASLLEDKKVIRVATKKDLDTASWKEADIRISSYDNNLDPLFSIIESTLDLSNLDSVGLYTMRDLDYLNRLSSLLIKVKEDFNDEHSFDLIAIAMNEAHHLVKAIAGEEYNPEEIYDEVFSSFCVGK